MDRKEKDENCWFDEGLKVYVIVIILTFLLLKLKCVTFAPQVELKK